MAGSEQTPAGTAARLDDEIIAIARRAIADEHGLTAQQATRLRGGTAAELRADAKAMRRELGMPDLDERARRAGALREAHGHERTHPRGGWANVVSTMNDLIRAAVGHHGDVGRPEPDARPKIGDAGIGRGASSAPRPRRLASTDVNARIRAAARVVRSAQLRDGLSIDLDNPWR